MAIPNSWGEIPPTSAGSAIPNAQWEQATSPPYQSTTDQEWDRRRAPFSTLHRADQRLVSDLLVIQKLFPDGLGAETPEAASWLCFFEEKAELVERVRGLPRLEAERVAYKIVLVEFLNRTFPDTPSDRCAYCGRPETQSNILLPIGVGVRHSWLHSDCWEPWRDTRRAKASDELAAAGIGA
jgi:hypothetical protein